MRMMDRASIPPEGRCDAECARRPSVVAGVLTSILALAMSPLSGAAGANAPKPGPGNTAAAVRDADKDAEDNEGPERLNERMRWFRQGRLGPDGEIPWDARNRALAQVEENIRLRTLRAGPATLIPGDGWAPVGPSPLYDGSYTFSGRITAIAVHPTNANVAYIGAAQGGVWKTTDHGATWAPLTDTQKSLAVGAIAIDPSNPNVIYVGTGEANGSCDSYFGAGILKSTDGGTTWTLIGATPFANTSVSRIIVHPSNSSILWAANATGAGGFVCYHPAAAVSLGIWKSTNGGVSWSRALTVSTHDLAIDPSNANTLYAGLYHSGVWKSTNGGVAWSRLTGGLPAAAAIGRVALAIDPGSPTTLYSVFSDYSLDSQYGTYKSTDGGSTWSALTKPSGACEYWSFQDLCTYSGGTYAQCSYDLVIGVAPDHAVWIGGTGVWRSGDGGATWNGVCPASVHVDQHALAFSGSDVWLGNDGGVFTTADNGVSWTSRNVGLALTQFYPGAAAHPTNASVALGGAQDNGVLQYTGAPGWTQVSTGDGAFNAIDFTNPDSVFYVSTQFLNIRRYRGGSWLYGTNGLTDANTNNTGFVSPFVMCPNNAQVLVAGSNNVWRTVNGAGVWSVNSPDPLNAVNAGAVISALAFASSTGDCSTYFAGDNWGRLYRTADSGATWTDITSGLPGRGVNHIAVDPTNAAVVVVGFSGFGIRHVWRSTNALDPTPTWNAIDAGIPDAPVNAVLIDPSASSVVYLGTDVGIFRSTDAGATWQVFMGGHPNVAVFDLVANVGTGTILSFTHGRGVFRLGTFCNDNNACTADTYDQVLGCRHTPVNCDDGNLCTDDSCAPASGCLHTNNTAPCSDGNACTAGDACQSGVCVGGAPVPPPAAPTELAFTSASDLNWAAATGASGYDVIRGTVSTLLVDRGFTAATDLCVGWHIPGTFASDSHVPTPGDADWVLIRAESACGTGTYDDGPPSEVGSRDAGIAASPNACP